MCGITGFFSAGPLSELADTHLSGMMDTLEHRGPDGRGRLVEHDRGLALGHTRLTINDLNSGAQPLRSLDGRYALVANGELYDFKRLRATLMAEGARFATKSDSELALALYARDGLDFVQHLRGEFAMALYDRERDELLLIRDRFGIRPLFFRLTPDSLFFGSEVKAILAHPDVPRRLCGKAAWHQLMQTMVPGTTAFEGVEALQPGCIMRVRRHRGGLTATTHRYWDLSFPDADNHRRSVDVDEAVQSVRDLLVEAVAHRLVADVPVGCYLSGGIDSCSILGLATGAQQSPVKAFTISFDHDDYDEAAIAVEMARSMAAEQELIRLDAGDLYGHNFLRTVWHSERSFYNTLGVAKLCMSERVHACGYKTVVTGEGSDELFGGYPAFKQDMFLHGLAGESDHVRAGYEQALAQSNGLFRGAILPEEPRHHAAFEKLCGFTPTWLQGWIAAAEVTRPLLSDGLQRELADYDPIAAIAEAIDPAQVQGRHPLDIAQYTWVKTMLEGQILNWGGDRVDMANAMESRPAFLDHHLAEAAVHIPPRLRIRGNTEKWVLREAVRGVLPEVLYKREKFAFMAPPAHTDERKKAALRRLTDKYLSHRAVAAVGLLDPRRVQAFIAPGSYDATPTQRVRKDALVNHLLCLHILHDQFVEGSARTRAPSAEALEPAGDAVKSRCG